MRQGGEDVRLRAPVPFIQFVYLLHTAGRERGPKLDIPSYPSLSYPASPFRIVSFEGVPFVQCDATALPAYILTSARGAGGEHARCRGLTIRIRAHTTNRAAQASGAQFTLCKDGHRAHDLL